MGNFGDISRVTTRRSLPLRSNALTLALLTFGFGGLAPAATPPQYALKDLGTLGGKTSSAAGINATGQVTGGATLSGDQVTHAFIYTNGVMKDIGTPPGDTNSSGSAINASGQLSVNDGGNAPWRYSNGTWTKLDPQASYPAYAWGINDRGYVTGITQGIPFFYNGANLFPLNSPLTVYPSTGLGINNSDLIVGNALTGGPQGQQWGFTYDVAQGLTGWIPPFGGALYSGASAVNGNNYVTGWADNGVDPNTLNDNPPHAYLYDATGQHDLGTLGGSTSNGNAINDLGDIVGSSTLAGDAVTHAFLYSSGTMVDLNKLITTSPLAKYVTLNSATGINNNGWIVANGVDSRTGESHGYLLEAPSLDGSVTPPATQLIDDSLATWTVSKGQAFRNGQPTPSSSIIELLFSKGVIYQENVHRNWYAWRNGTWVATASPISPSLAGTTVPTAASLVDADLNIWALAGGQVYENGTLTPSGGVILLLFDGGIVYQENSLFKWWQWNAATHAWVASSDPRVPSVNETSIPPATQIVDGSLNTWTLSNGQVYENGQLTPSSSVIRLLLSNGVIYQKNVHNNWWAWRNGIWVAVAGPSADGTTIPSATQIVDNALNVWTVSGGVVYENQIRTQSSSVTLLLFYGGTVYQENVHNNWYRWTGSAWVATANPRP